MANKLYAQYRNKSKALQLSEIPVSFREQCQTAIDFVKNSWDIDSNSGEALDVIGRIVERDRSIIQNKTLTVYQANNIGDFECGDDSVQLSPKSIVDDGDLSDDYYRYLLRAKIAKNNSDASIDSILTSVNYAAPGVNAYRLVDGEDMTFSIEFYGAINPIFRDLMLNGDIVPRPQGVKFNGFLDGLNMVECNLSGDFECGDDSTQCVGFTGASN